MSELSSGQFAFIFSRIREPLYTGRENVYFQVPDDFLMERGKEVASYLIQEYPDKEVVKINDIRGEKPDLSEVSRLSRNENFSIFNEKHRQYASELIGIFMDAPPEEFCSTLIYVRDRVNPYLFVYASYVTILHRRRNDSDFRNISLPSHVQMFPQLYIRGEVFSRVYQEAALPVKFRKWITVPLNSPNDLDPENRVAYWKEDIALNVYNWYWHLENPITVPENYIDLMSKTKRRGEKFYYRSTQISARYNFERLSNHLGRVRCFDNWRTPISEACFPKLNDPVVNRSYPPRQPYSRLQDIRRNGEGTLTVYDVELWKNRIIDSIRSSGFLTRNESTGEFKFMPWEEATGIDILGNIIEAADLSVNKDLYGDLYNAGHRLISWIHDPDHRYEEDFGVMGNNATAMRDPLFYVWNTFILNLFQQYKATLNPYSKEQLGFDGISITGLQVQSGTYPVNQFHTSWAKSNVDVSMGLDFEPKGPVEIMWTHQEHNPFTYTIEVLNAGPPRVGTVRIFLAPEKDEGHIPLQFEDQRKLAIELDKFTCPLKKGLNKVKRNSVDSNITISYEELFAMSRDNISDCGWPDYLLIPKGTPEGLGAMLFVMISDGLEDAVTGDGVVSDSLAMGYPFDRPSPSTETLKSFADQTANMFTVRTSIHFHGPEPDEQEESENTGQQVENEQLLNAEPEVKDVSQEEDESQLQRKKRNPHGGSGLFRKH